MNPAKPRVITYGTPRRDLWIALGSGLAVLIFVVLGIAFLSREQGKPSTNQLTGTITAKHYSGEKASEITYGKKGLSSRETESGYSFDILVAEEKRTYEVPVSKALYDSRKVGERQSFIRPPSEQQ